MSLALFLMGGRPAVRTVGAAPALQPPTTAECLRRTHRACLTPAQVRAHYGIDILARRGLDGRGRTIVIVDSFGSQSLKSDLATFDAAFRLPNPSLTVLAPLGTPTAGTAGWASETTLDVEWAHAIAPGARIVVLESPVDETEGLQGLPEFLKLEQYALDRHMADVISQSWGATEDTLFTAAGRRMVALYHQMYTNGSARGVTFVAGSGDQGAAGIDTSLVRLFAQPAVSYPASDPLVLSVGGTTLGVDARGAITTEAAWPLSGGGMSKLFAAPNYQLGLPPAVRRLLAAHRGMPDVAYDASTLSAVLIVLHGRWHEVGGTSAGAPQWAGLAALADQLAGRDLGSINAALYATACSSRYGQDFLDVSRGYNVGPTRNGSRLGGMRFIAGRGWDAVTGLGAPRAAALVPDLVRLSRARPHPQPWQRTGACA